MRILTISAHYPPALSGVGDYTACLAAQLAEWGHEVTVLTGQTLTPGPSPAHGRGETSGARPVENQTSSFTPLPSRGRGAGGEGEPPAVPPLPSRGGGAGGEGLPVEVLRLPPAWGLRAVDAAVELANRAKADTVLLQYSPFMYDHRGVPVAMGLLPLRLRRAGVRVVTVLHEMFVPWRPAPVALGRSAMQRAIVALLIVGSHALVVPSFERLAWLRRWFPSRRDSVRLIPVGSNIPVVDLPAAARADVRRRWGAAEGTTLLSTMNPGDPSKLGVLVLESLACVARVRPARLVCIAATEAEVRALLDRCDASRRPSLDIIMWTGHLPAGEVGRLLTASDLYLIPFADGASTRRTTLIAGLAHGLATVSTRGYNTGDDLIAAGSAVLVPLDRPDEFRAVVGELAADPARRAAFGRHARRHFEAEFAWPEVARRLLAVLEPPRRPSPRSVPHVLP